MNHNFVIYNLTIKNISNESFELYNRQTLWEKKFLKHYLKISNIWTRFDFIKRSCKNWWDHEYSNYYEVSITISSENNDSKHYYLISMKSLFRKFWWKIRTKFFRKYNNINNPHFMYSQISTCLSEVSYIFLRSIQQWTVNSQKYFPTFYRWILEIFFLSHSALAESNHKNFFQQTGYF